MMQSLAYMPKSLKQTKGKKDSGRMKTVMEVLSGIIENLDPVLLNEIYSCYEKDIDMLVGDIIKETYKVIYGDNLKIKPSIRYFNEINHTLNEELRKADLSYFCSDALNMQMNWHHVEWGWLASNFDKIALIAARDHGKCLGLGTKVVMADGRLKKVEHIKIGDLVMGPDSKPRKVMKVHKGEDDLYEIKQSRGDSYIVNSRHIMSIYKKIRGSEDAELLNVEMPDFLKIAKTTRERDYRGFKVRTEFPEKELKLDPYYLGLWLGDGHKHVPAITTMDYQVAIYCMKYARRLGLKVSIGNKYRKGKKCKAKIYTIARMNGDVRENRLKEIMKGYGLINNKHIPDDFMYNSAENRLKLLAGIVDTDGFVKDNCIYISFKGRKLARQVQRLANTLGFMVRFAERNKYVKYLKRNYRSYELCITGMTEQIPCKVQRRKIIKNKNLKNHKVPKKINGFDVSCISALTPEYKGKGKYYGFTLDNDGLFLLADNTVAHNSYYWSHGYPLWKAYKYDPLSKDPLNYLNKKGYIFSNSSPQAYDLIEIIKDTTEENPEIREKLFPDRRETWSKTQLKFKNGCRIKAKGFGSSVRGGHPGYIVCDDSLKDNVLYSEIQRERNKDYFRAVILNMLVPKGQIVVVGTPFHEADLYSIFKESIDFAYREYPAIDSKGNILWPDRYNKLLLDEKKRTNGSLLFTREFLCKPISNDMTLFPLKTMKRALMGMGGYSYVSNIQEHPVKFKRIVTGCDFALSSSTGADYCVFITAGIDEYDNMWILNIYRAKGVSFTEQKRALRNIHRSFKPDIMLLEANQFQSIYTEVLAGETDMPVVPFTTTVRKHNLEDGVPGMVIMFENGKFRFPYQTDKDKEVTDWMFDELNHIAFTEKGIQGVGMHDDGPMALWITRQAMLYEAGDFIFTFAEAS